MTEADRIARNAEKLAQLYPTFAKRIAKVIAALEADGIRPRIQDAYRSPADQLIAFNKGNSKLKFGFHNVTGDGGKPESLAVDLLDDDSPVSMTTAYFLRVAVAAQKNGLVSGIRFGLPAGLSAGIDAAIAAKNYKAAVKVGWDPTHIEPTGITPTEARGGKRPA